jgi:hypothetical protein
MEPKLITTDEACSLKRSRKGSFDNCQHCAKHQGVVTPAFAVLHWAGRRPIKLSPTCKFHLRVYAGPNILVKQTPYWWPVLEEALKDDSGVDSL